MPLVLPPRQVFALLAGIFALVGWPIVARGVRAIVASERERDYVTAGRALGAGPLRVCLPSICCRPRAAICSTQATLLLPAFILAEATLSYVGLGFPDSVPTWGTMLQDASNVALVGEAPWMLAPAAAIFLVVLAVNLAGSGKRPQPCTIGAMSATPSRRRSRQALHRRLHADRHPVHQRRHARREGTAPAT